MRASAMLLSGQSKGKEPALTRNKPGIHSPKDWHL